jgi:transmembrane sensor
LFSECYEKNVECFQGNSKVTGLFNKRAYKTHLNMEDIYIIISKYLLGTASPQEEKEIMEWRNADAGHEQEFQELCESWQIAHAGIHPVIPDKERVWGKIMSNLNLVKPVKMYTRRLLYRAVGIAAMLALVLGFSLSLLVSEEEEVGLVSFTAPVGR